MTELAYTLALDEEKSKDLRRGKQVFKDTDGHRWYITADEVKNLGEPKSITVAVSSNGSS